MLVVAPNRVSGLGSQAIGVDELAAVGRGHHADVPSIPLGKVDQVTDAPSGRRTAHQDVKHTHGAT